MSRETPVVLLHGLGARPLTLAGLEAFLRWFGGYADTRKIAYPADTAAFDACVAHVDAALCVAFGADRTQALIVVGQSMGGVVGAQLHARGWCNIRLLVTIGSPVRGASLLRVLERHLPSALAAALWKPNHDHLLALLDASAAIAAPPPHPYHSITMSWPLTTFDGCVYVDEARYDAAHHSHLPWADHRTVFANPRLWWTVYACLERQEAAAAAGS